MRRYQMEGRCFKLEKIVKKKVKCPFCEEDVIIEEDRKVGEYLECLNCKAEMQILSLEPPEVSLLEEEK
ncbi:MAG: hypothetical protein Q8Q15_00650 [bacterium]|nr:hypothetical protein [bacterium]